MTKKIDKKVSPPQQPKSSQQPVFIIEKIYVDDISLESPHTPEIFLEQGESTLDTQVRTESKAFGEHFYTCSVTITVSAKLPDKRTLFLVEIVQSGVFQIQNVTPETLKQILGIACPNILYPYAREAISNTISRAGFPPILISPVNFETLYSQQQNKT